MILFNELILYTNRVISSFLSFPFVTQCIYIFHIKCNIPNINSNYSKRTQCKLLEVSEAMLHH